MNVSKEQEIINVINHIEEAVWNGRQDDSKGYVIDLSNTNKKIEISANIVETKDTVTTETHFKIGNKSENEEEAIRQYLKMDKPYVFDYVEYNNLMKLSKEMQKMFMENLLEIVIDLEEVKNNRIGANSVRVELFKKENEKEKLYAKKQQIEKEYIEISEKKEQNIKNINNYVEKLKRSNNYFNLVNLINRVFSRHETEEQNKFYKSEAVRLEKENIKNTELIFEKLFHKNDLNKQITEIEKEVKELREQYELENKDQIKESDILKEKNMLFRIFGIDKIEEFMEENEIQIEEESE